MADQETSGWTLPEIHAHGLIKFKISVWVKFDHFNQNYPLIATSGTGAFQLHGLGPAYGVDQGKVVFYLQTPGNVGSYGRGTGQIRTLHALKPGQWHHILVEKELTSLSISVDGAKCTVKLPAHISAGQFEMKPTGNILVKQGTGDMYLSGRVRDFVFSHDHVDHVVESQG
eukprot:TRINITY_DN3500_c0_g1_i2.p1 TRINITY_DN3500_c0_g1~~TRINITY_DN3500_c0_g1_i2.p1  ORF type:complete len:187 (-),score=53.33 TRINITY_DN3500_c0_g1_i2:48-560(-)